MWSWIRNHRRKKILETPFPSQWELYLQRNVVHYRRLGELDRQHLRDLLQVFVAEKRWEGCGGLKMTDEIRVTIAAQACVLVLALPHDLYRRVDSILVYPTTVLVPERPLRTFEVPGGLATGPTAILGQVETRGPVVLVWDSVLRMAKHPERGHNVVFHEFAHALDLFDGLADGTPPLDGDAQYRAWVATCSKAFLELRAQTEGEKATRLDPYGATNEAEFFAVITEEFFERPVTLQREYSGLYDVFREFYRQGPAEAERTSAGQSAAT